MTEIEPGSLLVSSEEGGGECWSWSSTVIVGMSMRRTAGRKERKGTLLVLCKVDLVVQNAFVSYKML